MKWTKVPKNLSGLNLDELTALRDALRSDLDTNLDSVETIEAKTEWEHYRDVVIPKVEARLALTAQRQADAEAAEREAAEREAAEQAEREAAEQAEREAAEQAEREAAEQAEREAAEQAADDADADADEADDDGEHDEHGDQTPVPTGLSLPTRRHVDLSDQSQARHWRATDVVEGKSKGEEFADFTEIAEALMAQAELMTPASNKRAVAKAFANFAPEQILDDNPFVNLPKFEQLEEITAAMCAPLQPIYDLACANAVRRPVRDSLPVFRAPTRGGFSVYPSPSLSDVTQGFGQWTSVEDADAEAVKDDCLTIQCATPVDYRIYGLYRCLTVKNLLQMTFPELVEAYLNRLAARHSRLGDVTLLEAMGTEATTISAVSLGYGATQSTLATVLNFLGLYQEIERWDNGEMEAWMPRWFIYAIQKDQVSRRRTDGGKAMVPSVETINSWFREAGVNPHWYMDRPSWATPIPPLATASVLNFLPRNLEILVAPRGKFALMDRGDLSIGVAPGNLYRDNTSNSKNEFTLFFENFEGVINTNTCPAHIIEIPDLCYNGQQIADVAINCEGADYSGVGS